MEDRETLLDEAREIISKELTSISPKFTSNTIAGKQLRSLFVMNCMDNLEAPFTSTLASCIARKSDNTRLAKQNVSIAGPYSQAAPDRFSRKP
jgi:hypothetical protein